MTNACEGRDLVAGRHGVGFISPVLPGEGGNEELIFSPRTYQLMGDAGTFAHRLQNGTAILQEALVSGPGVSPRDG